MAYTCTASGTWGTPVSCLEQERDVQGRCGAVCSGCAPPSQTQCTGTTPQTCSAAGTWTNQATCAQPSPDCQNGACKCLETQCGSHVHDAEHDEQLRRLQENVTCNATRTPPAVSCNGTTCAYTCGAGFAVRATRRRRTPGGCACATASSSDAGDRATAAAGAAARPNTATASAGTTTTASRSRPTTRPKRRRPRPPTPRSRGVRTRAGDAAPARTRRA